MSLYLNLVPLGSGNADNVSDATNYFGNYIIIDSNAIDKIHDDGDALSIIEANKVTGGILSNLRQVA